MRLSQIKFKNHPILGNLEINFTNERGDIYSNIVFVGENGCGKTTILKEIQDYNNSNYIVDKEQNIRFTGQDIYRSLIINQDLKYKLAMNEVGKNISGEVPYNFKNYEERSLNQNMNSLLKNNIVNSSKKLTNKIQELNNEKLKEVFSSDKSNEELMKGIAGLVKIASNSESEIDNYSSGEQELIMKLNLLKTNIHVDTDFVLVDEPETSLHPKWQFKIFDFIKDILKDNNSGERDLQLFIATHSENILKAVLKSPETLVIRLFKKDNIITAEYITNMDRVLPYIANAEIQYLIFDIPTSDYHNALYGEIHKRYAESRSERTNLTNVDEYLLRQIGQNNLLLYDSINEATPNTKYKTLPTFIRNVIHHPESQTSNFADEQLKISIDFLRSILIKTPDTF